MPYGTGPFTLDPEAPADAAPRANDASFTRFANLLDVDARSAGFSYDIASSDPPVCHGAQRLYVADAADFIYVLLEFLGAHEALRDNPVVIAGESYGGTRAPVMLYMMQNYTLESDDLEVMTLAPPWLKEKMQVHLDAAFPGRAGARPSHERRGRHVVPLPDLRSGAPGLGRGPSRARRGRPGVARRDGRVGPAVKQARADPAPTPYVMPRLSPCQPPVDIV